MATGISTTTRRGVIGAVAAISAASLCGTVAASPTEQPNLVAMLKDASVKYDAMLNAGVAHHELQSQTRYIAYKDAKFEFEWAIEQLMELAETL